MNIAELKILTASPLSFEARVLYAVGIKPESRNGQIRLDYHRLTPALTISGTGVSGNAREYTPRAGDLNSVVCELIAAGLLRPAPGSRQQFASWWDGVTMDLPLHQRSLNTDRHLYRMTDDWQPDSTFKDTARLAGIIDASYTPGQLAEFTAYWAGRDVLLDNHRWNLRFISFLKKIHNK